MPEPPAPLAISLGEPGGIGLQLLLALWANERKALPPLVLYAPPALVRARARRWRIKVEITEVTSVCGPKGNALPVIPVGEDTAENCLGGVAEGSSALSSLEGAVAAAQSGRAAALVTLPLTKGSLPAGFVGQTEFCAAASGNSVAMMLLNSRLRAVPATTHIPLADVPNALSKELLVEKGLITLRALQRDFGRDKPKLSVAGLNPHAGEGGLLGDEEERLISPAIEELRGMGKWRVEGPVSADAMFASTDFDGALCMYHDQALIAVKSGGIADAVNVSLGLNFVRTSPAHGTAFAVARREVGDYSSLKKSLLLAAAIVERRRAASGGKKL